MALFRRKQKTAPAKNEPVVLWNKTFTQSGSFRGFRRIRLSRYFHEEIDKNVSYLGKQNYDMKGRTIQLTCIRFDSNRKDGCRINLRVDGMLLGSVWQSDEQWPMLTECEYDKVHVRIEDTMPGCTDPRIVHTKVHLFIHYPADAK